MANPYTSVTVNDYNLNPPSDDGTQVPSNALTWAKHKTKIGDPLKTAIESINTNISTATGKLAGGVTAVADDYTVLAADQGKTIVISVSGKTITTPTAATVGASFKFGVLNTSSGDVTISGNNIDGTATITLPSLRGVDVDTDGSNWFTKGQNWEAVGFAIPSGRLTLTTAVPVLSSDVTGASTVYYTPYNGNTIKLWNGTKFFSVTFSEVSQALSDDTKSPAAATTDAIYDMFGWLDGTTFRVTRGPAWSSSTSRGTGAGTSELERVQGVLMNKIAISNGPAANRGIYLGTIATNGSTQMAMMLLPSAAAGGSANRLDVWNMYNRVNITSVERDSTNSWTYSTATWRPYNGDTSNVNNRITFVRGLAEEPIDAKFNGLGSYSSTSTASMASGIGLDATNAIAAGSTSGIFSSAANNTLGHMRADFSSNTVGIGLHFVQALENHTVGSGTGTWIGDNNAPTTYQTGLILSTRM